MAENPDAVRDENAQAGEVKTANRKQPAKKAKEKPKKSPGSGTTKGAPWSFPKHTLEDALQIPKAIEDKNAGNPMSADVLAKAVGYNQSKDWRFKELLISANRYGLVSGSGSTATVSLEKIGRDVVVPSSPEERQESLLKAFRNVADFKGVEEFYGDKKIPEDEFFTNTLTREFNVPRDRVDTFSEVFLKNIAFLRAFNVAFKAKVPTEPDVRRQGGDRDTSRKADGTDRVRRFLDTCFVMMPYGAWYDRYYQEVYIPAIREAGFEPVRADELFGSGSVVEQIWEQIAKARVLLADLTDKNPNVFYELGLAHAARKPVVFSSGHLEDVPFDLRHLRVIVYEVREPNWSEKLARSVTEYLKNAVKDPGKSIPHPFRDVAATSEAQGQ